MFLRTIWTATATIVIAMLTIGVAAAKAVGEEAPGESNLPYLFAAFAVVWAGLFAYVFYMMRKERELRRELEALRRALKEKEGKGGG